MRCLLVQGTYYVEKMRQYLVEKIIYLVIKMEYKVVHDTLSNTGPTFLYGDSDTPPHLVLFYDHAGNTEVHILDLTPPPRALTGDLS